MTVVAVKELIRSDYKQLNVPYFVTDDGDPPADVTPTEAQSVATSAFFAEYSLVPTDVILQQLSTHSWRAVCVYSIVDIGDSKPPPPPAVNAATYSFAFRAEPKFIKNSFETVQTSTDAPEELKGLLNTSMQGGVHHAAGAHINVPAVTDRVTFVLPNSSVINALKATFRSTYGKINSSTWQGQAANTAMLVEASGTLRNLNEWSIELGFAIGEKYDLTVGEHLLEDINPFDYIWTYDRDFNTVIPIPGAPIPAVLLKVRFAYVERVWQRANFNSLGLPSGIIG